MWPGRWPRPGRWSSTGRWCAPGLDSAEVTQPVLWAVMVALAAVWQAAGITPDAVLGHSQGEIAAATVAGILTLEDAARVVAVRSRALSGLDTAGGQVRLFSTVTCGWADGAGLDAGYWYDNVRNTVRFAEAVRALAADGYRMFVEVSAHPVLTAAVTETAQDAGADAGLVVTGTLDREPPGARRLLASLARVHTAGPRVDWAAVLGTGRRVDLPTYAFQHQLFWPEPVRTAGHAVPVAGGDGAGTAGGGGFWAG